MRLHNFIKISNYANEYFANIMPDTGLDNRDSESDYVDTGEFDAPQGEQMAQLRDNIANMLWENQNNR